MRLPLSLCLLAVVACSPAPPAPKVPALLDPEDAQATALRIHEMFRERTKRIIAGTASKEADEGVKRALSGISGERVSRWTMKAESVRPVDVGEKKMAAVWFAPFEMPHSVADQLAGRFRGTTDEERRDHTSVTVFAFVAPEEAAALPMGEPLDLEGRIFKVSWGSSDSDEPALKPAYAYSAQIMIQPAKITPHR